jgi:hypothetical protein
MLPPTRNPASRAASRASGRFCVSAEPPEDKRPCLRLQDELTGCRRDTNAGARVQAAIPAVSENLNQVDELALALRAGAISAIRRRAERQAAIARAGTSAMEGRPDVLIRTGKAAIALRLAEALNQCADDLEVGRLP